MGYLAERRPGRADSRISQNNIRVNRYPTDVLNCNSLSKTLQMAPLNEAYREPASQGLRQPNNVMPPCTRVTSPAEAEFDEFGPIGIPLKYHLADHKLMATCPCRFGYIVAASELGLVSPTCR